MPISKVIASARPQEPVLDFDVLRAEGVQHLENLATELWTDYNAHDPGITLLELLCYAITDLGYRTRMIPVNDILSGAGNSEKEWFTAAEILPGSPVTRLDYRKWLIDTKGVKNAWMFRASFPNLLSDGIIFPELFSLDETGKAQRETNGFWSFDQVKLTELLRDCAGEITTHLSSLRNSSDIPTFLFSETGAETPGNNQILVDTDFVNALADALNEAILEKASFPAIRTYVDQLNQLRPIKNIAILEIKELLARLDTPRILSDEQIDLLLDNMDRATVGDVLPISKPLSNQEDSDRLRVETNNLRSQDRTPQVLLEEAIEAYLPVFDVLDLTTARALVDFTTITEREFDEFLEEPRAVIITPSDDAKRDPTSNSYNEQLDKENTILEQALIYEVELHNTIKRNIKELNGILYSSRSNGLYEYLIPASITDADRVALFRGFMANPDNVIIDLTAPESFYVLNGINRAHQEISEAIPQIGDFLSTEMLPDKDLVVDILAAMGDPYEPVARDYWGALAVWQEPLRGNISSITRERLKDIRGRLVQDRYRDQYSFNGDGTRVPRGNLNVFVAVMDFLYDAYPLKDIFVDTTFRARFLRSATTEGDWIGTNEIAVERFLTDAFPGLQDDRKTAAIDAIVNYLEDQGAVAPGDPADDPDEVLIAKYIMNEKFCDFGYWGLEYKADPTSSDDSLAINGLYHVLLDLDEDIDTGIPNQVIPVLRRVKRRLHLHRGLCEDYVQIDIVEQRPGALCINMEVRPDADEIDIAAEAIRQMQEYLSPVPRFRTFKQRIEELRAAGENCSAEQVFNGPCLDNGFLLAEEMGGHLPREVYQHSDLLRNMMSVEGIIGLPVLKVDEAPELDGNNFAVKTTYKVYSGNFSIPAGEPISSYLKPIIDLQQSFIQVKKGARTFSINMDQVEDRLKLFRLINSPDPLEPTGGPEWENGTYRPDLSNHRSIQFDLPDNYLVGDNPPPADSKPDRKAKSKQLQAFLAFFDQILASYLHQLGRVREMLSVEQEANAATWVLPLMYDMPGLRDLIGHDSPFQATATDWNIILQEIRDDLMSISKGQGNTDEASDRALAELWIADYREATTEFAGFIALTDGLKSKLSGLDLPDLTARRFSSLYLPLIENYFWKKFQADEENSYVERMNVLSESPAEQQNRKNRLLDHLLARFGESFSEFATALLRPEAEPEDNPRQQSFEDYLQAKTEFLQEIADLAKRRSLGYNYLAYRDADNAADVWNTLNVSGVQRRVVRKLGMSNWETRSLNTEPNYRIDRVRRTNRRGMANFRAVLRRRTFNPEDNPIESTPLMTSPAYNSPRLAQDKINELYRNIWEAEFREITDTIPENEDFYWYRLLPGRGGKFRAALYKYNPTSRKQIQQGPTDAITVPVDLLLQSELLSEDEARNRIFDEIIPLTRLPQTDREHEGFHIVEHILLRPLEADDPLLQLSLGCVPEETPKDPYTFWVTVVVPADTTRFADPDFRSFFEHTFREELPAHIAPRFCYLDRELMYEFEELFAIWMFEKAKCDPPNYCREDVARGNLVELLNRLPCGCGCSGEEPEPKCE